MESNVVADAQVVAVAAGADKKVLFASAILAEMEIRLNCWKRNLIRESPFAAAYIQMNKKKLEQKPDWGKFLGHLVSSVFHYL